MTGPWQALTALFTRIILAWLQWQWCCDAKQASSHPANTLLTLLPSAPQVNSSAPNVTAAQPAARVVSSWSSPGCLDWLDNHCCSGSTVRSWHRPPSPGGSLPAACLALPSFGSTCVCPEALCVFGTSHLSWPALHVGEGWLWRCHLRDSYVAASQDSSASQHGQNIGKLGRAAGQ